MPLDDEVSNESAIRRLLAMYCQFADDFRIDEWIELFTKDAELIIAESRFSGHAELRGFIESSRDPNTRGKHIISEPWIEIDGDRATARTDCIWISKQGVVGLTGRYHDDLVRTAGVWRFQRREIRPTG